jgi:MtrB/PioB family decaheme-associated outer membrane protein
MNNQKVVFLPILSLLMIGPGAWADTVVSGEVDAGYQYRNVSANEATFDQYGKVAQGAVIPYAAVNVVGASDTVHFEGNNIQQNNQSYDLNYNHNYSLDVDASWDQIPHDYSNVAVTPYTQAAPGVFVLPSQVQSTIQNGIPTALPHGSKQTLSDVQAQYINNEYSNLATFQNANLQTQDNKSAVDIGFKPSQNVKADIGVSEDRTVGNKPMGASFGSSQAVQLPEPIDYETYNLHAGTQYNTKDVQAGIKYQLSSFNNNIETLTWDNSKTLTNQAAVPAAGQMSLAPNNMSNTVTLNGGANLPLSTRFTASGNMAYLHQNDGLLSWTDNPALVYKNAAGAVISQPALPETSANADIMTWTQDYAMTNRSLGPLTLGLRYHSTQTVDHTDEVDFPGYALMDYSWQTQTGGFTNASYDTRKDLITGSVDYDVFQPLSLGFKYNVEWDHQSNRIVTGSTTNGYAVDADYKPAQWTTLRTSYLREHRVPHTFDYSVYLTPGTTNYEELPGLQQFDIGDRLRDQGKVMWQINPGQAVTIGLNGGITHDNYESGGNQDLTGVTGSPTATPLPATLYGLLDNRDSSGGVDVGWNASDRLYFDVSYDYELTQALMRSNEGNGANVTQSGTTDWDVQMRDKYQLAGVHANVGGSADRVTFKLGYDVTMSRGSDDYIDVGSGVVAPATYVNGISVAQPTGSLISPADTKYMKQDISIRSNIKMTDHTSLVVGYLFEKYDVSDWQNQNITPTSGTAAGQYNNLLATNLTNYVAHVVTILVKYKF